MTTKSDYVLRGKKLIRRRKTLRESRYATRAPDHERTRNPPDLLQKDTPASWGCSRTEPAPLSDDL